MFRFISRKKMCRKDWNKYNVTHDFSRKTKENYRDLIVEVPETDLGKLALSITLIQYTQERPVTDEEFSYMSKMMELFFTPRSKSQ